MRPNKKQTLLFIAGLATCILFILVYPSIDQPKSVSCIQPPVDLAYPVKVLATFEPTQVPLEGWEPIVVSEKDPFRFVSQMMFRNETELWMLRPLMRYSLETQQLKTYEINIEQDALVGLRTLWVTRDKTLWIAGIARLDNEKYLLLAYYDETKDQFVRVIDEDELLLQDFDGSDSPEIKEGINNQLWILYGGSLIRYDSKTNVAKTILDPEYFYELGSSMTIDQDGVLWLVARGVDGALAYEKGQRFVMRYDHQSKSSRFYGSPPGYEGNNRSFTLFVDHLGRVWADDYGWLQIHPSGDGTWYHAIRSPIFISDRPIGQAQYGWFRPAPLLETEDRYIWFGSAGLGRLDLLENHWCLLNTIPTNTIAMDSEDNIWIAGDGRIFKQDFQP